MPLDPTALIGAATSALGAAIADEILTKNPTTAQANALLALAASLPLIPQGKLSPSQLGQVAGQLQQLQASITTTETTVLTELGSVLAAVQSQITPGGDLSATSALIFAALQNFANGVIAGVQFWQGEQAVLHPAVAAGS